MRELVTNIVPEPILRQAQLRALKTYSDVISCTYGPAGGLTTYSKTNVDNKTMAVSNYSKDGLTVLKNVEVDQPIEALLKDELIDICANVVKVIGDGTSTAVLLAYEIFKGMLDLHVKDGLKKRDIIKAFKEIVKRMDESIQEKGREATLEDIKNIALTSTNGNTEMANMLAAIYSEYGMNVWIDVQASSGVNTIVKGYDGMSYDSGYLDPCFINNEYNHTCELRNPHIYVFESPIDTPEMIRLFSLIIQKEINEPLMRITQLQQANKPVPEGTHLNDVAIICPFISRDANAYLDQIISSFTQTAAQNRFHFCIISDMNDDPAKLIDIMKLTGAKFIKKYIDAEQFKADKKIGLAPDSKNILTFFGTAEKMIIDSVSTRIINPEKMRDSNGKLTVFFQNYIAELKDILSKKEETRADIVDIGKLKRRIHNLMGNMVDLYIGGIGTSDRKSLMDSIEDAVLNCRSAAKEGVGFGASYEGLRAINSILKSLEEEQSEYEDKEAMLKMAGVVMTAYINIVSKIYEAYYESKTDAVEKVIKSISTKEDQEKGPFNIVTEEYDQKVLTSIKTESAILESLARIITVIFDTNQYLVPTPQFNCYTEKDSTLQIVNTPGSTTSKELPSDDADLEFEDVTSEEKEVCETLFPDDEEIAKEKVKDAFEEKYGLTKREIDILNSECNPEPKQETIAQEEVVKPTMSINDPQSNEENI